MGLWMSGPRVLGVFPSFPRVEVEGWRSHVGLKQVDGRGKKGTRGCRNLWTKVNGI